MNGLSAAWSKVIPKTRKCNLLTCQELADRRAINNVGVTVGDFCNDHALIQVRRRNYRSSEGQRYEPKRLIS